MTFQEAHKDGKNGLLTRRGLTEYNENGKLIHYKNSYGYEKWYYYDDNGNEIKHIME